MSLDSDDEIIWARLSGISLLVDPIPLAFGNPGI